MKNKIMFAALCFAVVGAIVAGVTAVTSDDANAWRVTSAPLADLDIMTANVVTNVDLSGLATTGEVAAAVASVDVSGQIAGLASTNYVKDAIGVAIQPLCTVETAVAMTNAIPRDRLVKSTVHTTAQFVFDYDVPEAPWFSFGFTPGNGDMKYWMFLPYDDWNYESFEPEYVASREWVGAQGYATTGEVAAAVASVDVSGQIAPLKSSVASLSNQVQTVGGVVGAWTGYWGGDDFRVVVTNYPSVIGENRSPSGFMPELFLSWKTTDDNGDEVFQVVWNERWWQDWLLDEHLPTNYVARAEYDAAISNLEDNKADRAWGAYDSTTGNYAPEGYTQISSPHIIIAAGMGYQRFVSTAGSMWVLTSNGTSVETGGDTNGFFRVSDEKGNPVWEIVSGSKVMASAPVHTNGYSVTALAGGLNQMTIPYHVEPCPVIYSCNDLTAQDWKSQDDAASLVTVAWSGTASNYVATVTTKAAQAQMFVRAEYEVSSEPYIKNHVSVEMQTIRLGGKSYTLGTATIDGKTVLTLTEEQ